MPTDGYSTSGGIVASIPDDGTGMEVRVCISEALAQELLMSASVLQGARWAMANSICGKQRHQRH
jgi:hypothetical protein